MIARHLRQPSSTSCGQTCVAMILGCAPEDVIAAVPGERGTTAEQLCGYLEARGWRTSGRCLPLRKNRHGQLRALPAIALCRVRWGGHKRGAHWVLWADGRWWDPLRRSADQPAKHVEAGGRVLSYVRVVQPDEVYR